MYTIRTRTTGGYSVPSVQQFEEYYYPSLVFKRVWDYAPPPFNVPASQEIDDEWCNPENQNPCADWKTNLRFRFVRNIRVSDEAPFDSTFTHAAVYGNYLLRRYILSGSKYFTPVGLPPLPTRLPITAPSLATGFKKLQPSFKDAKVDGINIYTAILELADLKKTFTKSAWALKQSFRDIPEKNLLINFGVLPLFGDMVAIYDIVTRLGSYIDTWNNAAKNGMVWDRHVSLDSVPEQIITFSKLQSSTQFMCHKIEMSGSATVKASGKAHLYFRPRPIKQSDRKRVYANALGLAQPLSGVWEAVPFSWAIDYFLHVGDIIEAWDEALPTMFRYDFVSAGYSLKSEVTANIDYQMVYVGDIGSWKSYELADPATRVYTSSEYLRTPVSYQGMIDFMERPDDYQVGWDRGLRQASYLASVAYLMSHK